QFRLIPSGAGLVPAGSGNHKFAIYNMVNNRYLVYQGGSLVWQELGGPPGGPVASADFVSVDLFVIVGTNSAGRPTQVPYLTIKNIGNVRSMASQQELKVTVCGIQ